MLRPRAAIGTEAHAAAILICWLTELIGLKMGWRAGRARLILCRAHVHCVQWIYGTPVAIILTEEESRFPFSARPIKCAFGGLFFSDEDVV